MIFKLEKLEYKYDALEPHIDAQTMEIHHTKHHQAYIDNLNKALVGHEELAAKTAEELLKNPGDVSEEIKAAVKNNAGGHLNHEFFWTILKKDVKPEGEILNAINQNFESFDNFKEQFKQAAATQFNGGWAWLVFNITNRKLEIIKTKDHETPITDGKIPLLVIDVWEHAYYIKYQNKRPEYIDNFFNVINWNKVNEYFLNASA
jgi:superoxide dismutase, Fe-Mn family